MDGDEILREIVERKTRMQSYTPFNLDATVQELSDDYTRAIASTTRARNLRRELRDGDVNHSMDALTNKIATRTKELVEHNQQESVARATKFEEVMARLQKTAADHKAGIRKEEGKGDKVENDVGIDQDAK